MINVHFIAAKDNVIEDIATLRKIRGVIREQNHTILDDWIEHAFDLRVNKKGSGQSTDWVSIYKNNLENIAKADVVVAETSYNTFGVGYQIAVAAQQKKPILLLRHENTETDVFAAGIVDSWIKSVQYTDETLASSLKEFLDENDISVKDMRFNFFIDRHIYNYLRWAALKTGKTKAEVLRDLVQREIENKEP